ncbi:MAG: hypothetical protein AAF654_13940 [Myxococcota bacterium]
MSLASRHYLSRVDVYRSAESERFPELGRDRLPGHRQPGLLGDTIYEGDVFAVRAHAEDGTAVTQHFEIPGLTPYSWTFMWGGHPDKLEGEKLERFSAVYDLALETVNQGVRDHEFLSAQQGFVGSNDEYLDYLGHITQGLSPTEAWRRISQDGAGPTGDTTAAVRKVRLFPPGSNDEEGRMRYLLGIDGPTFWQADDSEDARERPPEGWARVPMMFNGKAGTNFVREEVAAAWRKMREAGKRAPGSI